MNYRRFEEDSMTDKITAWKFLRDDMRSGRGNEGPWHIGETRALVGGIVPCERGYHGSPTPFDALQYAPGSVVALVELSGDVTPHGSPVDKYAARTCKLISAQNIEHELRLFAADCAERVLPIFKKEWPNDDRPRKAIEASRAFANGEIGAAAMAAAWVAAGAAARDATGAAAGAAAGDAAWVAAGAAAGDAAWVAAGAAARDATGAAAWVAARDIAGVAETTWQRERFNSIHFEVQA